MTGMIEWRQNSGPQQIPMSSDVTQKNPWTKNNPRKISCQITPKLPGGAIIFLLVYSSYHKYAKGRAKALKFVFNAQKIPSLNQVTQKILAKFSNPKKSQTQKFQPPKKSFDHPCHLHAGVTPPGKWPKPSLFKHN